MEVGSIARNIQRKQALYKSLDEGFRIQKEKYTNQQYNQMYCARLRKMKIPLHALVKEWKPDLPVCTVSGLEKGKECIIVGTLYKHMKLEPCILDEYSKERSRVPLVKPHNFIHPDDQLFLEDESGRVKLGGTALVPSMYVTGVVMALCGKESDGEFLVLDIPELGLPHQIELPSEPREDKYVVFVSGLGVGKGNSNPLQSQLFLDHITGHLGDEKEQNIASRIVRVVIAGNSVETPPRLLNGQILPAKDQSRLSKQSLIKELDIWLTQLAAVVPLDIMPGSSDPADFYWPQQPLHRYLFPGASAYSCTNPHSFEIDNIRFLGTSGQNIDDLEKYSVAKDKLDFMERTLRWRHLAPTAPDTLGCYPFTNRDPFFIESCPHVYFVGNQDKYDTSLLRGSEGQLVKLICIPKFCETGVAIVVKRWIRGKFTSDHFSLGIAKGLAFLHEELKLKIIHRDIKPTNVLLDKDLNAKISDFGLARHNEGEHTHIITKVAGTSGYMAPEYAMRGHLTNKADVYSFGVVMLEIVSGKNSTDYRPNDETVFLLDLAYVLQQKGNLLDLIDPELKMDYSVKEATRVLELAMCCTNPSPTLKPLMSEVVSILEGKTEMKKSTLPAPYSVDEFRNANLIADLSLSTHSGSTSGEKSSSFFSSGTSIQEKLDRPVQNPLHDISDENAGELKKQI